MNFQCRVTRSYNDVSGVIAHIAHLSNRVIAYEHLPDAEVKRLHTHFYVFGYTKKEDTCRNFIKSHDISGGDFEWSQSCGKKDSKRPVDLSGAIIYGSKGELDPVYVKQVEASHIQQLTIEARDPKYHPKKQTKLMLIDGELSEDSKITQYMLVQIMISRIGIKKDWDRRVVLSIIRDVLIQHKQKLGLYKVQDFYDSCLMYGNAGQWLDKMDAMIGSREARWNRD